MRAGNLALIAVLLAGTMAWAGDFPEGALWKRYPQTQGGLRSSVQGSEEANRAKLDQVPAGGNQLEAFRNAYYFAYAVPAAGGLDMNRDGALDFAAKATVGSDPKRYVQVYQTVFYDQLEKGVSVKDAQSAAKRVADNPRGGDFWTRSTEDIKKELHDWAVSPNERLGPALTEPTASKLADELTEISARSMEGTDRSTTNKFVAFRSLFYLANSKPTAGGLDMTVSQSIQFSKDFIAKDNAVVRVELLRNYYRSYLLTKNPGDMSFTQFKQSVIDQARADALGAKIEPAVGGGVKITPAPGASAK